MSVWKLVSIVVLAAFATGASITSTALEPRRTDLVQALSPRCSTPAGICYIQPQPIGSPCFCGQFQGTIIW